MMKNLLFCLLASAAAYPAMAADKPVPIQDDIDAVTAETRLQRGIASGVSDRTLFITDGPQLELVATEAAKKATLSWAISGGSVSENGKFRTGSFLLQIATAFDGSTDEKSLFGLKGFAGGTDVSLGYTHFWGRIGDPLADAQDSKVVEAEEKKATRNCIKRNLGAEPKDLNKLCNPDHSEFDGSRASFLEKYNREGFEKVYGMNFPEKTIGFLGGKVTGNQQEFKYVDVASFAQKTDSKFGYEASVFGGVVLTGSPTAFTASFTASREYEAQKSLTVCQPTVPPQTQCLTGPNGAPAKTKSVIGSLEARHGFSLGKNGSPRMAISIEGSYDIENDAFAIDLPLYLFADDKGALRGGIRAGYTNSKDTLGKRDGDFKLGIFFGVPFSIF